MNPISLVAYNTAPDHLPMTLEAIESAFRQDLGDVTMHVVDNGSTDGTWSRFEKMESHNFIVSRYAHNVSPVKIANQQLHYLFRDCGYRYVLAMPSDVILPHNLYSEMLKWPRGFVTASMTDKVDFSIPEKIEAVSENTPLAVVLVRSWAYEAVMAKNGYFLCEEYFHYCSDCQLALDMAACGIRGLQLNLPYYHYGSSSHRHPGVPAEVRETIGNQAGIDRATFIRKNGFAVDALEYGQKAVDINFRG